MTMGLIFLFLFIHIIVWLGYLLIKLGCVSGVFHDLLYIAHYNIATIDIIMCIMLIFGVILKVFSLFLNCFNRRSCNLKEE